MGLTEAISLHVDEAIQATAPARNISAIDILMTNSTIYECSRATRSLGAFIKSSDHMV
jgi:hypothetical protein